MPNPVGSDTALVSFPAFFDAIISGQNKRIPFLRATDTSDEKADISRLII